ISSCVNLRFPSAILKKRLIKPSPSFATIFAPTGRGKSLPFRSPALNGMSMGVAGRSLSVPASGVSEKSRLAVESLSEKFAESQLRPRLGLPLLFDEERGWLRDLREGGLRWDLESFGAGIGKSDSNRFL